MIIFQCSSLNNRGKIQARAMGEHFKKIGLPISKVITSVSCRARQTADIAFGGYDSMIDCWFMRAHIRK